MDAKLVVDYVVLIHDLWILLINTATDLFLSNKLKANALDIVYLVFAEKMHFSCDLLARNVATFLKELDLNERVHHMIVHIFMLFKILYIKDRLL